MFIGDPQEINADTLLITECGGGESNGVIRRHDAFKSKISCKQRRVGEQSRRALFHQLSKHLPGCQQLVTESVLSLTTDYKLRKSQRRQEHGQNKRRKRKKDLGAQTAARPPANQ